MTQRDGIGREVGGGFRIGNTCGNLWWIHVDVWQNQYNIVKLKKKKRKKGGMWREVEGCSSGGHG